MVLAHVALESQPPPLFIAPGAPGRGRVEAEGEVERAWPPKRGSESRFCVFALLLMAHVIMGYLPSVTKPQPVQWGTIIGTDDRRVKGERQVASAAPSDWAVCFPPHTAGAAGKAGPGIGLLFRSV